MIAIIKENETSGKKKNHPHSRRRNKTVLNNFGKIETKTTSSKEVCFLILLMNLLKPPPSPRTERERHLLGKTGHKGGTKPYVCEP